MKFYSSAYNIWPNDERERKAFCQALSEREWIGGIELGFADHISWPEGFDPSLPAIVSGIPGTMHYNSSYPSFGLASKDEAGRRAALDWVRQGYRDIIALQDAGYTIRALQLHSAPTMGAHNEAFERSLDEIASWEWGSTHIWIEHCDAAIDGQEPNKGYLHVDEEISIARTLHERYAERGFNLVINWARSAIEGRDIATGIDHISRAAESGLLVHVGLSICSDQTTDFGPAWTDAHLPFAHTTAAPNSSLLDADEIRRCYDLAGDVTWGIKVGIRPADQPYQTLLATLDEQAELVLSAISQ